VSSLAVAQHFC